MKRYKKLMPLLMAAGIGLTFNAVAETSDDMQVRKMEQHWQQLINEKNPEKRQKLLMEHRHMMDTFDKSTGAQMGRGMGGGHHNMMNTVDMHRSMMDMME